MHTTHTYTYTQACIQLNNIREEIQVVYHKEMSAKEALLIVKIKINKNNIKKKAKMIYGKKLNLNFSNNVVGGAKALTFLRYD